LLGEITGYRFNRSEVPEEIQAATAYCAGRPPWPAPGSVTLLDRLAVVCLRDSG
jgi:hypothetical protein